VTPDVTAASRTISPDHHDGPARPTQRLLVLDHPRGGSRNFGKKGLVGRRSPEPSAEGARAGGGSGGPPPENFEKLDAISCNLAYIFGIRMASDIIQNGAFAEQKKQ